MRVSTEVALTPISPLLNDQRRPPLLTGEEGTQWSARKEHNAWRGRITLDDKEGSRCSSIGGKLL